MPKTATVTVNYGYIAGRPRTVQVPSCASRASVVDVRAGPGDNWPSHAVAEVEMDGTRQRFEVDADGCWMRGGDAVTPDPPRLHAAGPSDTDEGTVPPPAGLSLGT